MKPPVPVILTTILLGLLAALSLVGAAGMAAVGFTVLHKGIPGTPPPTPFPPSFLPLLFLGMSLVAAALAVWLILTLIGLVRLRSWARYSVLVTGGLMTLFGGTSALTMFAMPLLMPALPTAANQPALDPGAMRGVFFGFGAVYAVFAAIGILLLVYYNLAKTRAIFLQNAPASLGPPHTSTGRPRPTAITVISWLYLVSAPFCLIYLFLPIPGFVFGFILHGAAARLLYASFGIFAFVLGYGLYRLWNWARLAMFAWFGVAVVNTLILFTPWGRSQLHAYMDEINAHMYAYGGQQSPPNFASSPVFIGFFSVLGLAFCVVILWLLHRYREAFTLAPPAPPMPDLPAPAAG